MTDMTLTSKNEAKKPSQLIVLGMHRSGTSCITRLIDIMGAYCGSEDELIQGSVDNDNGYWERLDINRICNTLLASVDADWWKISEFSIENLSPYTIQWGRKEFEEVLRRLNRNSPWVIKEPRLCLFFSMFRSCLVNPLCIQVYRNPVEVAKSLRERNGFGISFGLALWEYYNRQAISATEGLPRLFLSYNRLMADPTNVVRELHQSLIDLGVVGLKAVESINWNMVLEPKLYHCRDDNSFRDFLLPGQSNLDAFMSRSQTEGIKLDSKAISLSTLEILRDGERNQTEIEDVQSRTSLIGKKNQQCERALIQIISSKQWKIANAISRINHRSLARYLQSALINFASKFYPFTRSGHEVPLQTERSLKNNSHCPKKINPSEFANHWKNPFPQYQNAGIDYDNFRVIVIIEVRNSLYDVKECLASVKRTRTKNTRLIVIADGADNKTVQYLAANFEDHPTDRLIISKDSKDTTFRIAESLKKTVADYTIILGGDTIVSKKWIQKLLQVGESDPKIGIVGSMPIPSSTLALAETLRLKGHSLGKSLFSHTFLVEMIGWIVESQSDCSYPRVEKLSEFCLAIKRKTIDKLGAIESVVLSEKDHGGSAYCRRAFKEGISLAIATHTYVYQKKFGSGFTPSEPEVIECDKGANFKSFNKSKQGELNQNNSVNPQIEKSIKRLEKILNQLPLSGKIGPSIVSILILFPKPYNILEARQLIREIEEFQELGVNAKLAVPIKFKSRIESNFLGYFPLDRIVIYYRFLSELFGLTRIYNVIIATSCSSINELEKIWKYHPSILPAYYARDYDLLSFETNSSQRESAFQSYTRIPEIILFTRTEWIRQEIQKNHHLRVHKLSPSLDQTLFHAKWRRKRTKVVRIVAMVQLSAARHKPYRTLRLLKRLKDHYSDKIDIRIFGSDSREFNDAKVMPNIGSINYGLLDQRRIASLLRDSDLFVELSEYQIFDQITLEAMACGLATILPKQAMREGFVQNMENSVIVDNNDEDACFRIVGKLIEDRDLRKQLQERAALTSLHFPISRGTLSSLILFLSAFQLQKERENSSTIE